MFFTSVYSQADVIPKPELIKKYGIKNQDAFYARYKKDTLSANGYLIFARKFDKDGNGIEITLYDSIGGVRDLITASYKNGLEIKNTVYGKGDVPKVETSYKYNENNKEIYSRTESFEKEYLTEKWTTYETDSLAYSVKKYQTYDNKNISAYTFFYDKNWRLIRIDDHGTKKDTLVYCTIFEYDTINNIKLRLSLKKGIKTLLTKYIYNADSSVKEQIHYYSHSFILYESNGTIQAYKAGDIRDIIYNYDTRGILIEQIEKINGVPIFCVKYVYR